MVSARLQRRLRVHHLPLAVASLVGLLLVRAALVSDDAVFEWSMATAYVGLALLGVTLAIGPLQVLRGRGVPVSSDLRRDVGIWAGVLALLHVAVGMWVHMPRRFMYWLVRDDASGQFSLRTDAFGLTNHAGAVAALVAVALLVTSNDAALRRLGRVRWKGVQRLSYALYLLVIGHAVVFELLEKRAWTFVVLGALLVLPVLFVQAVAFVRRRTAVA